MLGPVQAPALGSLLHFPSISVLRSTICRRRGPLNHGGGGGTTGGAAAAFSAAPSVAATSVPRNALLARLLLQARSLRSVLSIHTRILKSGLTGHTVPANHLLNAYVRLRAIDHAQNAFDEMSDAANVVSWTSLMAGHVAAGRPVVAISLLRVMQDEGVLPNSFTITSTIHACAVLAHLRAGRQLHGVAETSGMWNDLVVSTALVDMYGKCNQVEHARQVFDRMALRNMVSWGSMLSVYTQNARAHEALGLFGEFLRSGVGEGECELSTPNHFILCSTVGACASLGRLGAGKAAHAAVIRRGHGANDVIAGALVDMYAKCGCVEYSHKVFQLMESPRVIPFTSMIVAAARHGLANVALELFDDMLTRGVRPNEVTLLGILHACNHGGLVDRGLEYLDTMVRSHGVRTDARHYTCAVDMLGRAGRLEEALDMAKGITTMGNDAVLLWTALLSAGGRYGRLDITAMAREKLKESGQDLSGAYVTMSNTYAAAGRWETAVSLRAEMMQRGIRKTLGCSWVEVKDAVYVFSAGCAPSCPRADEVSEMLLELEARMREMGYAGGSDGLAVANGDEDVVQDSVISLHSEKLALAFALVSLPGGVVIRVMKNLRMCGDCHEYFKSASAIVGRKIVVRDLNRFHHFSDGSCTCRDYW